MPNQSEPRTTKRALSLLPSFAGNVPETIAAIARFAAQNPGMDPRNYGWGADAWRSYRAESRQVSRDLQRVRELIQHACYAGVTNADVLEACRSDRLEVKPDRDHHYRVEYCTGQYFPTEYRRACARVLGRAIDAAQARNVAKGVQS